jgi:hypothetical protein
MHPDGAAERVAYLAMHFLSFVEAVTARAAIEGAATLLSLDDKRRKRLAANLRRAGVLCDLRGPLLPAPHSPMP